MECVGPRVRGRALLACLLHRFHRLHRFTRFLNRSYCEGAGGELSHELFWWADEKGEGALTDSVAHRVAALRGLWEVSRDQIPRAHAPGLRCCAALRGLRKALPVSMCGSVFLVNKGCVLPISRSAHGGLWSLALWGREARMCRLSSLALRVSVWELGITGMTPGKPMTNAIDANVVRYTCSLYGSAAESQEEYWTLVRVSWGGWRAAGVRHQG